MVTEKILQASSTFTPKQIAIANYISEHLYDIALMNAAKIAKEAGVSEATLTRFIYAIGYGNFSDFQLDVIKDIQKPDPVAAVRMLEESNPNLPAYNDVINLERALLEEFKETISDTDFSDFVNTLIDYKKIIIFNNPMDRYMTEYLADYMNIYRDNVYVITKRDMRYLGTLLFESDKTAAVMVCYPRYPNDVIEIARDLKTMGVKIMAIADALSNPIIQFADVKIITPIRYIHFVTPMAPAMAFIHSVLIEIYRRNNKRIKQRLTKYEEIVEKTEVFSLRDFHFKSSARDKN